MTEYPSEMNFYKIFWKGWNSAFFMYIFSGTAGSSVRQQISLYEKSSPTAAAFIFRFVHLDSTNSLLLSHVAYSII
jgi:hypothetical protein